MGYLLLFFSKRHNFAHCGLYEAAGNMQEITVYKKLHRYYVKTNLHISNTANQFCIFKWHARRCLFCEFHNHDWQVTCSCYCYIFKSSWIKLMSDSYKILQMYKDIQETMFFSAKNTYNQQNRLATNKSLFKIM